ncbi:hypothetical protein ACHAXR_007826 [Thalassiosira sp. AJA248-18]
MSETDLPGIQERIWCDKETEAPTVEPSKTPTANPTAKPVTDSPTKQPTKKPVTDSPTKQPTQKPVTDSPTQQPTQKPVTDSPTKQPTQKPVTDSPTKQPTQKPVTDSPTQQPTQKPVTYTPTKQPTARPVTALPTMGLTPAPTTESPTNQPTQNTITSGPTKQPSAKPVTYSPIAKPTSQPIVITGGSTTNQPTMNPTDIHTTTSKPTTEPTIKLTMADILTAKPAPEAVTDSLIMQPTAMPVTGSPTKLPTVKPATHSPTATPTPEPITTKQPTTNPTTEPPTKLVLTADHIESPTDEGDEVTEPGAPPSVDDGSMLVDITPVPTIAPSTQKPTRSPTDLPTSTPTDAPISSPSVKVTQPPTSSPELSAWIAPLPDIAIGTPSPSGSSEVAWIAPLPEIDNETGETVESSSKSISSTPEPSASPVSSVRTEQDDASISWYTVPISPFTLSLQTAPQTNAIDTDELTSIASSHLLKETQTNFANTEVTRVNVNISSIPSRRRRRLQAGLAFSSDNGVSKEHEFAVSGQAYFADSSMPTTDELDAVAQESFEGESGDEFIYSLQNAEDSGLQSTRSISVDLPSESNGEIFASHLGTSDEGVTDGDPIVGQPLYVLGVVFGVGFLLVAMYVFKTRRGRINQLDGNAVDEVSVFQSYCASDIFTRHLFSQLLLHSFQKNGESVDVPELPRYIEVENENDSDKSEDSASARSALQYNSKRSIYDESSGVSPEGVTSSAKASSNDVKTLESQVSNSGTSSYVGCSSKSSRNSSQKSQSESEHISIFVDLPSILEGGDRNQGESNGWNLCGDYTEQETNFQNRPSLGDQVDGIFCGDVDDSYALTTSTQSQVTGDNWGQKPYGDLSDTQSLQTSRVSNTSK